MANSESMRDIRLLFDRTPGRLEYTVRLSVICALTTYLVQYYQTPEPALTAYLIFFLNKPDRTGSVITEIGVMLMISIVIALIMIIAIWVIDSPFLRVISMAILSLGFLFLGSASKLQPVAAILALIVGYSLDLLGSVQFGEMATRGLLYAWLFICTPAFVSMGVNLLIGPSPESCIRRTLIDRIEQAIHFIDHPDKCSQDALCSLLQGGNKAITKWLKFAKVEHSLPARNRDELQLFAEHSFKIITLLTLVPLDDERGLQKLKQAQGEPLRVMLQKIKHGDKLSLSLPLLTPQPVPGGGLVNQIIHRMSNCLDSAGRIAHVTAAEPEEHAGFFHADAFTNPAHVHYAIKTTAAAMFCYLFYTLVDWPGIHTCFITCYIVSLGTAGEAVEKLRLRIAGCLLGAMLGVAVMIWLVPMATSIESLLAIVIGGTLLSGWVAAGSPRIAYAGLQIAFAFYLCVIQGSSPEFDLTIARDRVIGILIGNFVAYVMLTSVWPVSIGSKLDQEMTHLMQGLRALSRAVAAGNWSEKGPALYVLSHRLRRALELAELEPRSIRPSEADLNLRRAIADKISLVNGQLLLIQPPPGAPVSQFIDHKLVQLDQNLQERLADNEHPVSGVAREIPEIPKPESPTAWVFETLSSLQAMIALLTPIGIIPNHASK